MSVFDIYKEAINAGGYSLAQMEERIETVYACGKITKEERAELLDLVSDKGDHLNADEIMTKLVDLESRLSVLESSGVKVWVNGMVTAKGQTVLYDIIKEGTLRYCRYDGGRAFTSLSPGKIDGWVILASAGGAVTHRAEHDADRKIILVPVNEEQGEEES